MFWISALKLQATYVLGNSNKYPKHMFYGEIRIKQGLSYISFCPLRILYNSKVILMATSLGTNDVVVTRVYCMSLVCLSSYLTTLSTLFKTYQDDRRMIM